MSTRKLHDKFFKLAKAQGYVARSAYKLAEIQKKHRVIAPGGDVLDLGCAPGAWLQVACRALGPTQQGGSVLGLDLQEMSIPRQHCDGRVRALVADVHLVDPALLLQNHPLGFQAVLSDMCPATIGHQLLDVHRSLDLARAACVLALGAGYDEGAPGAGVLQPSGNLLLKLLQGSGSEELAGELRKHFAKVRWLRPQATRNESREVYLLSSKRL